MKHFFIYWINKDNNKIDNKHPIYIFKLNDEISIKKDINLIRELSRHAFLDINDLEDYCKAGIISDNFDRITLPENIIYDFESLANTLSQKYPLYFAIDQDLNITNITVKNKTEVDDESENRLYELKKYINRNALEKTGKINEITETFSKQDITASKLTYGYGLWAMFYQKCQEVEDSFFMKDDKLEKDISSYNKDASEVKDDSDEENVNEIDNNGLGAHYFLYSELRNSSDGDIASRDLNYNFDKYYNNVDWPKFDKKYLSPYKAEITRKKRKLTFIYDITGGNKAMSLRLIPSILVFIVCTIIFIVTHTFHFNNGFIIPGGAKDFFASLGCGLGIGVGTFLVVTIVTKIISLSYKDGKLDYNEYKRRKFDEIRKTYDYKNKEKEFKDERKRFYKKEFIKLQDNVTKLKDVKKKLLQIVPLPPNYSNVNAVNGIYFLLVNKRAETIKEAINIYVNEVYQKKSLLNDQILNNSLLKLNNKMTSVNKKIDNVINNMNDIYRNMAGITIKTNN